MKETAFSNLEILFGIFLQDGHICRTFFSFNLNLSTLFLSLLSIAAMENFPIKHIISH